MPKIKNQSPIEPEVQARKKYTLQFSRNNRTWHFVAAYREGEPSRFGPFCNQVALQEAQAFREFWGHRRPYVRLIVEL